MYMQGTCAHPRSTLDATAQPERRQVIVMGMSRSGTSLTTSIVAALLGGPQRPAATWCGSANPYPKDRRTTAAGYFERQARAAHLCCGASTTLEGRGAAHALLRRTWCRSTTGCSRSSATLGRGFPPALRRGRSSGTMASAQIALPVCASTALSTSSKK